jgi:hypothetical protein
VVCKSFKRFAGVFEQVDVEFGYLPHFLHERLVGFSGKFGLQPDGPIG